MSSPTIVGAPLTLKSFVLMVVASIGASDQRMNVTQLSPGAGSDMVLHEGAERGVESYLARMVRSSAIDTSRRL